MQISLARLYPHKGYGSSLAAAFFRYSLLTKVNQGRYAVIPQSGVSCLARLVFAKGTRPQWLTCWLCCLEWEEGGSVLELPRKIIQLDLNNTWAEKGGGFPEISRYRLQVWLASYLY